MRGPPLTRKAVRTGGQEDRRPRIIFVMMTFSPEPGALHGLPLATWLSERGYDIQVITGFPNYPIGRIYPGYRTTLWKREKMGRVSVLRVPIYPSHDDSAVRRIFTYLSFAISAATIGVALAGRCDAVYLYDPPPTNGLASTALRLIHRVPVVHSVGDLWPDTVVQSGMVRNRVLRAVFERSITVYLRYLYRLATRMTVLSPGFKKVLTDRGVPASKIDVIYNWADEALFHPVPADADLRRELGMEGRFNFVFAGNLGGFQGIDTLIRAATIVPGAWDQITASA